MKASLALIAVATISLCSIAFLVINPGYKATKLLAQTYSSALTTSRKLLYSPTGGYAPAQVTCPANINLLRAESAIPTSSSGLSANETAWLDVRGQKVQSAWRTYLTQAAIPNFNIDSFLSDSSTLGKLAIAFSGGGFRAMLNGASIYNALDSRNQQAVSLGTGGVSQMLSYMTGLSGGSFFVGSLAINSNPTVPDLLDMMDLENSPFAPSGSNIFSDAGYYGKIISDVNAKQNAGFNISITDLWARAIAQKLINSSNPIANSAITYADIRNTTAFTQGEIPFPIVLAASRAPGQIIIPANSTIYEFNTFEFGSWSPRIRAFTPIQYLGTNLTNGQPTQSGVCVEGFDNFGFIIGTSSSIFNEGLIQLDQSTSSNILSTFIEKILARVSQNGNDIATYPNSFYKYQPTNSNYTNPVANDYELNLVDGGEDNENIPFVPLLQKERGINTIIAVDSSADTLYNWPNGSAMVQTYEGSIDPMSENTIPFPPVPSVETFINLGLNRRMTFFGCPNASNPNSYPTGPYPYPLVIYMPNFPHRAYTNDSTFTFKYSSDDVNGFLENGLAQFSNITDIKVCLACATIQRTLAAKNIQFPSACQTCFDQYCWNGERNDATPPIYNPVVTNPIERDSSSGAEHTVTMSIALGVIMSVCAYVLMFAQ